MTDRSAPRILLLSVSAITLLLAGCGERPEELNGTRTTTVREANPEQVESQRLAGLWNYQSTAVTHQTVRQKTATLHNLRPDVDDPGNFAVVPTVQLVLRNDPRWGQSVYLVIEDGRFECGNPCKFLIAIDAAAPRRFAGKASSTGTRPALFIEDEVGFIHALEAAGVIEVMPADGSAAPIRFEVGGFDPPRYQSGR